MIKRYLAFSFVCYLITLNIFCSYQSVGAVLFLENNKDSLDIRCRHAFAEQESLVLLHKKPLRQDKFSVEEENFIRVTSILGTGATATAIFGLFAFGGSMETLFMGTSTARSGLSWRNAILGVAAVVTSVPDAYLSYQKGLKGVVLWGQHSKEDIDDKGLNTWLKSHFGCQSASELLLSGVRGIFIGGGGAILTGKALFALYEVDVKNYGVVDSPWYTGITMTGFTVYQIFRVQDMLSNAWLTASHFTGKQWRHYVRGDNSHDEDRGRLKSVFATGFRKLLLSEHAGTPQDQRQSLNSTIEDLYDGLREDHEDFLEEIGILEAQISSLNQISKARKLSEEEQWQIKELRKWSKELKAFEVLVALKRLHEFSTESDEEVSYKPKSYWKPTWWYVAKGAGVATVGLAATCAWYGWQHVVNTTYGDVILGSDDDDAFVLPETTYDTLGTLLALPYIGILMKTVPDKFARIASLVMDYNPTMNADRIMDPTVVGAGRKSIGALAKGMRSWFAALPVALVGGEGMAANNIPLSQQWWTLVPNMVAAGCFEDGTSEPDMYELINRFMKATELQHQKQDVADLLTSASRYLKHLDKEDLITLQEFFAKPWEDILPDEASDLGSDEGKGASGSTGPRGRTLYEDEITEAPVVQQEEGLFAPGPKKSKRKSRSKRKGEPRAPSYLSSNPYGPLALLEGGEGSGLRERLLPLEDGGESGGLASSQQKKRRNKKREIIQFAR